MDPLERIKKIHQRRLAENKTLGKNIRLNAFIITACVCALYFGTKSIFAKEKRMLTKQIEMDLKFSKT